MLSHRGVYLRRPVNGASRNQTDHGGLARANRGESAGPVSFEAAIPLDGGFVFTSSDFLLLFFLELAEL